MYDVIVRMLAETLALGNAVVSRWVIMPADASGPLDANIALTETGANLVDYIASSVVHLSHILCVTLGALF